MNPNLTQPDNQWNQKGLREFRRSDTFCAKSEHPEE